MMALKHHPHFQKALVENAKSLNQTILTDFQKLVTMPDKESHFFHGRYENIYIDEKRFPALAPLLDSLKQAAAEILQQKPHHLKFGFWFNLMNVGDQTTSHSHDDDDELLSCVYYLSVPQNSGNLILEPKGHDKIIITPQEGNCLFFDPTMIHEVTKNLSQTARLSLAGNFGLKK